MIRVCIADKRIVSMAADNVARFLQGKQPNYK
jgi:hypothetical protein